MPRMSSPSKNEQPHEKVFRRMRVTAGIVASIAIGLSASQSGRQFSSDAYRVLSDRITGEAPHQPVDEQAAPPPSTVSENTLVCRSIYAIARGSSPDKSRYIMSPIITPDRKVFFTDPEIAGGALTEAKGPLVWHSIEKNTPVTDASFTTECAPADILGPAEIKNEDGSYNQVILTTVRGPQQLAVDAEPWLVQGGAGISSELPAKNTPVIAGLYAEQISDYLQPQQPPR